MFKFGPRIKKTLGEVVVRNEFSIWGSWDSDWYIVRGPLRESRN